MKDGTFLVVQYLKTLCSQCRGVDSSPGQGTRSCMPQWRSKILSAPTKAQCSKINFQKNYNGGIRGLFWNWKEKLHNSLLKSRESRCVLVILLCNKSPQTYRIKTIIYCHFSRFGGWWVYLGSSYWGHSCSCSQMASEAEVTWRGLHSYIRHLAQDGWNHWVLAGHGFLRRTSECG